MLALERQRKILEIAKRDGAVRTQGLSVLLSATEETMRRDLDSLARQGLLHRTHEGATKISMVIREFSRSERESKQTAEKESIAKLAVRHIGENETLMLDASSTALEFARHLPEKLNLRIVTYAIGVVERLAVRNDIEVILLGRKTDHYFVRPDQIDLFVTDAGGADYCGRGNLKGIPCEVG
jgi:DeoR/GlpR family transcriptional regulator of sugar metabolism